MVASLSHVIILLTSLLSSLQNGHSGGGRAILRESGRVLYFRGGFREAELSRGRTFLSVIRSGRSTSGDGSESS